MINFISDDIIGIMTDPTCKDCNDRPRTGRASYCKECRYIRTLRWRENNPEKYAAQIVRENSKITPEIRRKRWLKKKYGMTLDEYEELLKFQMGICKTCGYKPRKDESLVVDHNHTTGAIRGLLCTPCNTALGLVKERIDVLNSLISYLKEDK